MCVSSCVHGDGRWGEMLSARVCVCVCVVGSQQHTLFPSSLRAPLGTCVSKVSRVYPERACIHVLYTRLYIQAM